MYRNEIFNIKSERAMTKEYTISAGTMQEGLDIDIVAYTGLQLTVEQLRCNYQLRELNRWLNQISCH